MKLRSSMSIVGSTLTAAILTAATPVTALADKDGHNSQNGAITIYFTRHAEKETVTQTSPDEVVMPSAFITNDNGDYEMVEGPTKGKRLDQVCGDSKCAEVLSSKGTQRAMLLADWFADRDVAFDAVYASHKLRTQQTVMYTATSNGLPVINVVDGGTELNPQSTSSSECATLDAIAASIAAGDDTILVAGHSGTLYDIMGSTVSDCFSTGLGLNISDDKRFPKDEDGKVANFGDIWKVKIRANGTAVFKYRKLLDFTRLTTTETAR